MSQQQENLRVLLEQHWLHCRHLEYERAGFASIYAAIVVAVLTYILQAGRSDLRPVYFFLMAFTVIGLLLTIRWDYSFDYHLKQIEGVAYDLGIIARVRIPAKGIWKVVRTRNLFPFFYLLVLAGLIYLAATT